MASIVPKDTQMTIAQKKAILDKAADMVNEKAKKIVCGRISKMPDIEEKLKIKWIPTPSYKINALTGGGFPKGKFSIVAGQPDSGKTSLLLETIAYNMKKDPAFVAIWLESENSLTLEYMINTFDIDSERFFVIEHEKQSGAEGAMEILSNIADSGCADIVVVNSLKALVPKVELDNKLEKDTVAVQARFNSKMVKKFTAMMQEHDTAFVMISHLTTMIGSMSRDPYVISGGKAIMYASMLTLDMRKQAILETDPIGREEGVKVKVVCKKNHCICNRYPYGAVEYYARYGKGVAWDLELIQAGLDKGILLQKGAWIYEVNQAGETVVDEAGTAFKWNGKNALSKYLLSEPAYCTYLEQSIHQFDVEALSDDELKEIQSDEIDGSTAVTEMPFEEDPIALSRETGSKKKQKKS